jgi:hypothetical protein
VAAAQLCARDRRYPGSINTLGACLYRANRIEEAIQTLNTSLQRHGRGGLPQDWAFLALCHASLRNMEAATDYLFRVESWLAQENQRRADSESVDLQATWTERAELQLLVEEIRRKFSQL